MENFNQEVNENSAEFNFQDAFKSLAQYQCSGGESDEEEKDEVIGSDEEQQ